MDGKRFKSRINALFFAGPDARIITRADAASIVRRV